MSAASLDVPQVAVMAVLRAGLKAVVTAVVKVASSVVV